MDALPEVDQGGSRVGRYSCRHLAREARETLSTLSEDGRPDLLGLKFLFVELRKRPLPLDGHGDDQLVIKGRTQLGTDDAGPWRASSPQHASAPRSHVRDNEGGGSASPSPLELLPTPTASSQAYAAAAKLTVERKMPVEQKLAQMEQEGEFAKLAGAGKPFEQVLPPYTPRVNIRVVHTPLKSHPARVLVGHRSASTIRSSAPAKNVSSRD